VLRTVHNWLACMCWAQHATQCSVSVFKAWWRVWNVFASCQVCNWWPFIIYFWPKALLSQLLYWPSHNDSLFCNKVNMIRQNCITVWKPTVKLTMLVWVTAENIKFLTICLPSVDQSFISIDQCQYRNTHLIGFLTILKENIQANIMEVLGSFALRE